MNKEEYDKLPTYEKIDFDISMELYGKYNDTIATINDHLGEMYGYSDLRDVEELEKSEELKLYKQALKDKCNAIDKAIEYIKNKWYEKNTRNIEDMVSFGDWRLDLLEILGGKE
jgi:uncharacterized protein YjaZ